MKQPRLAEDCNSVCPGFEQGLKVTVFTGFAVRSSRHPEGRYVWMKRAIHLLRKLKELKIYGVSLVGPAALNVINARVDEGLRNPKLLV